jgi:hypothetical protein
MSELTIDEASLRHELELPVLGIPVRLRSDSPEIIAAYEAALGSWRVLASRPELVSNLRVEGRLVVHAGDESGHEHAPIRYRLVDHDRLLISTPGSVVLSEGARREFTGWVTGALVADREHFTHGVLESALFRVVCQLDRIPVHAAAIVRNGSALLLAGPSGTGKSTLTYAAARAGLQVLTDDLVFAERRPLRIWGMPTSIHVPPASRRWFPELGDHPTRVVASGKEKIALRLAELGAAAPFPMAARAGVCWLERREGAETRAERLTPAELAGAMLAEVESGFHLFRAELTEVITRLAERGGWRLKFGGHPADVVPTFHRLLDELEASP